MPLPCSLVSTFFLCRGFSVVLEKTLWCWRRLLRVPWTARRSNQSVLKEISPDYSSEGMTEADTPILWPPDAKNWLIGKDPDVGKEGKAGGEGDDRGGDGWMTSLTQYTWVWVNSGSWWWTGRPSVLQSMGLQRGGHDWAAELNSIHTVPGNLNKQWKNPQKHQYTEILLLKS